MFRQLLITLLALITFVPTAFAQLVGYEGFNYSSGSALNGLNGGSGWATSGGAWSTGSSNFTIDANSLTPPSPSNTLDISGNKLSFPALFNFTTASRTFGSDLRTVTGSSTVWISFVMTRTAGTSTSYGGLVIGNETATSSTAGQLFIGDSGNPNSDSWSLERGGVNGAIGASNFTVVDYPTVLLVTMIEFNNSGNERIALYVNPTPGVAPTSISTSLSIDMNASGGAVNFISIWHGADGGYQLDEIRIGATYFDVTPVPEPAYALAIVALCYPAYWIRRRVWRKSSSR